MSIVVIKVLEGLATALAVLKDGSTLSGRLLRRPSSLAGPGFDTDNRLKAVRGYVDQAELRVLKTGGTLRVNLMLLNATRQAIELDQVRVNYLHLNGYPLVNTAVFAPARGAAAKNSTGLGFFELELSAPVVRNVASGLKVAENRQSCPSNDLIGDGVLHFSLKRRELKVPLDLTRRDIRVRVEGGGAEGRAVITE